MKMLNVAKVAKVASARPATSASAAASAYPVASAHPAASVHPVATAFPVASASAVASAHPVASASMAASARPVATALPVASARSAARPSRAPSTARALKWLVTVASALVLCASMLAMPKVALAVDGAQLIFKPQTGTYVFDERGLLDSSEFATLEAQGAELAEKYGMGVYFLTTSYMNGLSDPTSSQRTSYATAYYKDHELGLNPTDGRSYGDGVMFVIAADSRDYVTIAYGQGSDSFSDEGIDAMEDAVVENIRDHRDDWYGAASTYYREIGGQLEYYDRHGKAQVPLDLFDWVFRIALILGVPGVITFFIIKRDRDAMRTAKERSEAGHYLDPSSVQVTRANDRFVNTTLVATPRPTRNDSDGGGGWGGGGGGGFSSSGGGKF